MQNTSMATAAKIHFRDDLIKKYSNCDHFVGQFGAGCRTIAYMCLNDNVNVLVNELVAL